MITLQVGSAQTYTTIQAAVNNLPTTLNDDYTISIDSGNYNENVALPTIDNNSYSLTITSSDPYDHARVQRFGDITCANVTFKSLTFNFTPAATNTIKGLNTYPNLTIDRCTFNASNGTIFLNSSIINPFMTPHTTETTAAGSLADSRTNQDDYISEASSMGSTGITIQNNVFNHNSSDTIVDSDSEISFQQNTIYIPSTNTNGILKLTSTSTIQNNIVYVTGVSDPYIYSVLPGQNSVYNNNIYYFPNANEAYFAGSNYTQWKANYETTAYNSDPQMLEPEFGIFHLWEQGFAVDKGIDTGITEDYNGLTRPQFSSYDPGAHEAYDPFPVDPPEPPAPDSAPLLCWTLIGQRSSGRVFRLDGPDKFPGFKGLTLPKLKNISVIEDGKKII